MCPIYKTNKHALLIMITESGRSDSQSKFLQKVHGRFASATQVLLWETSW
jgi:hypothetical protein